MLDTRADLTVFFISVGASSYSRAKAALANQDCLFTLEEIKNVCPMNAAFQSMLDRCQTRYYLQVDEDMVLRRDSVRKMYEAIRASTQAMLCFALWDSHLEIPRLGVKIYDHKVFRRYPYESVASCELDQLQRVEANGHSWRCLMPSPINLTPRSEGILGYHGTTYTPQEAFDTYRAMAEKAQLSEESAWFRPWMRRFLDRVTDKGSVSLDDPNLWAFMGCAAALFGPVMDMTHGGWEKDAERDPESYYFQQAKEKLRR